MIDKEYGEVINILLRVENNLNLLRNRVTTLETNIEKIIIELDAIEKRTDRLEVLSFGSKR